MSARLHAICWGASLALLALQAPAIRADDTPAEARVPVLVVDAGRAIEKPELDAIAEGLASPLLVGPDLASGLGFVPEDMDALVASVESSFAKAQDLFFSGNHAQAKSEFEQVVEQAGRHPVIFAAKPECREAVFKSHIHMAVIEQEAGRKALAEAQLEQAAVHFPDLAPSRADFPPWICERFAEVKQETGTPTGEIAVTVPPGCTFVLSGRDLGNGSRFGHIRPGEHAAQLSCSGTRRPAQRLKVEAGSVTEFAALELSQLIPVVGKDRVAFDAEQNTPSTAIVSDALAIARYGRWERVVAVVGRPDRIQVLLINVSSGGIARRAQAAPGDLAAARAAGVALVTETPLLVDLESAPGARPWYKDGLAWTATGVGAALLGTGLALGLIYGSETEQEVWALGLQAGGAGLMGTGAVLFFIPESPTQNGTVITRPKRSALGVSLVFEF